MTYARALDREYSGALSLPEKVMGLTALLMLLAVTGVAIGWNGANSGTGLGSHTILWLIAEIALLIATMFTAGSPIGLVFFAGFGLCTGLVLAPLLAALTALGKGGVIVQALAATGGITLGLTVYARTTTRDFRGIGGYLFAGLIGILIASFLGLLFHSTGFQLIISIGATILFSFYLVYDVQRITDNPNNQRSAIVLALGIYLDIFNIFINLLSILSSSENR